VNPKAGAVTRVRIVDAFTERPFSGNPAGVVRLDDRPQPPPDSWCAAIAAELNLPETAFLSRTEEAGADFRLRWFTPAVEVELCGHATLAAARCLLDDGVPGPIRFDTRSGILTVAEEGDVLVLDFPARPPVQIEAPDGLVTALGVQPQWVGAGGSDFMVRVATSDEVRGLRPDLAAIATLPVRGVMVTAPSDEPDADFVSRFFAPSVGVQEDPVTGSAHTVLGPYWAGEFGRTELTGRQLSARGGSIGIRLHGDRVELTGRAVVMLDGQFTEPAAAPA